MKAKVKSRNQKNGERLQTQGMTLPRGLQRQSNYIGFAGRLRRVDVRLKLQSKGGCGNNKSDHH